MHSFMTIEVLSIFFLFSNIPATLSVSLSFNFPNFESHETKGSINTTGDAYISSQGIHLTPNEFNVSRIAKMDRATYIEPLHLWDKNSRKLSDFSTQFSFVIDSGGRADFADGITFFLASVYSSINVSTASGSNMGLNTNSSSETFFAVEFNTYKNTFDPSIPHVGININSMVSVATAYWQNDIRKQGAWVLALGLGAGLPILFLVLALASCFLKKKRGDKESVDTYQYAIDPSMDDEFQRSTGAKKFLYADLASGTDDFAEELKLGEGGFGGVYRGFLKETDSYVAVKRISRGSRQGLKEYASEMKIISQLRHRNLVQLIGWCHERGELLLVYEFLPNGSLDSHLFQHNSVLTWEVRYKIAQGLASALLYLHEEWEQCVVHRDIKSSNIMLDSNFNAKLGDFGLARLVDHEKGSQTTIVAGTRGYMAPEYLTSGRASKESDIYSFGVVLLEIACGRKAIDVRFLENDQLVLVDWVWKLYDAGKILDSVEQDLGTELHGDEMERLLVVGLWCVHPDFQQRPAIRQAMNVMNFEAKLPFLPAVFPVPVYRSPSMHMVASSDVIYNSGGSDSMDCNHHSKSSNFTTSSGSNPLAPLLKTV
ncbi:L-type lectin-domain containing receptor kinase IX.1-like [Henckelia pumila]|uniref:L-type lectin-domain containing receptor kinase IX.1-like n=1 Tax=Henckelia pumila TaxID=405737 RepID=UPI003C6E14F4